MLYLSELLDKKVYDSADNVVGRLEDVLIAQKHGEYSPIKFLLVKLAKNKGLAYLPYEYVDTLSPSDISVKVLKRKIHFEKSIPEKYIPLRKFVLDHQIVDISGARVIRSNDLRLGNFNREMCVLAIDISTKGLLRRIGLGWLDFFNILNIELIDWRDAESVHGMLKLGTASDGLNKMHPADLANVIEDLNMKHSSHLVKSLDAASAATVLEELDPEFQKVLIKYWGPEQSSKILSEMPVEEIVDLMRMLPKHEAKLFLSKIKSTKLQKIKNLIIYPDDTAGGLMTMDFISVDPKWTVEKTIDEIKKLSSSNRSILYVYAVDEEKTLHGIVSLRRLLIAQKGQQLKEILKSPASHAFLHPDDKIEKIIEIMTRYDLFTAAVIDHGKLVGIVTIDEVMRHLFPHA